MNFKVRVSFLLKNSYIAIVDGASGLGYRFAYGIAKKTLEIIQ